MANALSINTHIDLAAFEDVDENQLTSTNSDDLPANSHKHQKRNQKRNDWAKGKNRSQPSENWDDDFLFGSQSAESLPLSKPSQPGLKPGSSLSTSPIISISSHPHLATPTTSSHLHSNSTTPRKPSLKPPSLPANPISPASTLPLTSSSRSRPPLFRPPASAPPSRAQSSDPASPHHPLELRRVSINHHHPPLRSATIPIRPPSPHMSPSSLSLPRRPSASHKAVSSQDSVPSISDLSSTGFRSPSSSLSMTDDSRGNWSRSSGDYSARFGGPGSGNLSFNTETEFTEPDTELDWADDTDLENRSAHSIVYKPRPSPHLHSPLLGQPNPQKLPAHLGPYSPLSLSSIQHSHPAALHFSSSLVAPAASDLELVSTTDPSLASLGASKSSDQQRRLAHSSFDSQSTFTSAHSAKSRKPSINNPPPCASAMSSTSSIGYYKSNHSDISLGSSTSKLPNQFAGYSIYSNQDALVRRNQPPRATSLSPGCSFAPGSYQSGSESYDAATSGTETDGASDQIHTDCSSARHPSVTQNPSLATPNRITSTLSQRSRKQALYTRPAYVNPASSSVSSLAVSFSSSTLNTSNFLNTSLRPAASTPADANQSELSLVGDDDKANKNNLRKKLRKKRPSVLPLNKPLDTSKWSSGLARKSSLSESIYSPESGEMGDLAFAADSEDEDRALRARSRTVAKGSTSPFEIVDKSSLPSGPGSNSPAPPRSASVLNRALSTKSRSNISRSSHAGTPSTTPTSCLGMAKQSSSQTNTTNNNKSDFSHQQQQAEDAMMKKFKPRRPLSFTALLSRTSMGSTSQTAVNSSNGNSNGQFEAHNKSRARSTHRYSASIGSHTLHPVHASSPHPSTATETFFSRVRRLSTRPQSAKRPSPPPSPTTKKRFSIIGGANNRFSSLNANVPPPLPLPSPTATPTPKMAEPQQPAPRSASKTQTRKGASQSDSIASGDVMLSGGGCATEDKNTVRGGRPSSRASSVATSQQPCGGSSSQLNLSRKFSTRTNNKGPVNEPRVSHSPTENVDHDLGLSRGPVHPPGSASSRLSVARRTVASKPPKSNPALRAKAEACAAVRDHGVEGILRSQQSFSLSPADMSPADGTFPGQLASYNNNGRSHSGPPTAAVGGKHEQRGPGAEQVAEPDRLDGGVFSDSEVHHHHHHYPSLQQQTAVMSGNGPGTATAQLARSNSMGELRIPSRITSQQAKLQTELNQVKEFARGIEDLKSMRRVYRKMIRTSTGNSSQDQHQKNEKKQKSSSNNDKEEERAEQDSGTEESDSTDSDTRQSFRDSDWPGTPPAAVETNAATSKQGEVSPRALSKLCSSIARIEESYREWWTCCNVLIDLGEGSRDPRSKFSPERIRAITAYNGEKEKAEKAGGTEKRHFEILKSMFGPGADGELPSGVGPGSDGEEDGEGSGPGGAGWRTPPRAVDGGKNASTESVDRTPISRVPGVALDMADPATPTAAGSERERSRAARLSDWNDSDCGSALSLSLAGSVRGKKTGEGLLANGLEGGVGSGRKEKNKKGTRHSSYHDQGASGSGLRLASEGSGGRGKGGGVGRIGISGIKDFLRVLKARVHLEEKWPSKLLVVASTMPTEVLKRRAVSTPLQEALRPRGAPGGSGRHKGTARGSLEEEEEEAVEAESRLSSSSSSSEEEYWDDLVLDEAPPTATSGVADGLDLAVPGAGVGAGAGAGAGRKKKMIGEARLALSAERMPQLLKYLGVVREMCEECLGELKAQTV